MTGEPGRAPGWILTVDAVDVGGYLDGFFEDEFGNQTATQRATLRTRQRWEGGSALPPEAFGRCGGTDNSWMRWHWKSRKDGLGGGRRDPWGEFGIWLGASALVGLGLYTLGRALIVGDVSWRGGVLVALAGGLSVLALFGGKSAKK